jgi:hypothetical protein
MPIIKPAQRHKLNKTRWRVISSSSTGRGVSKTTRKELQHLNDDDDDDYDEKIDNNNKS